MGRKRKLVDEGEEAERTEVDLPPKHLSSLSEKQELRLVVILENAQLESAKIGQNFELLNGDDHGQYLRKHNRDPALCRPDIAHQCLLMLLDSPLNRAGRLQVYVHTAKGVLIEINPQTRIPRTYKRFAGLMVQLLHKFSVRASDGPMKLLKVVRNPITDHLPLDCIKYGTSFSSEFLIKPEELVHPEKNVAIVVGAMAHGKVSVDYTEKTVSISGYPLSGALACSKITSAFESQWGIH